MKLRTKNSNWGLGLLVVVMLIVFLGLFSQQQRPHNNPATILIAKPSLSINNHTILLNIADTPVLQRQGLSDRESLPSNTGMLFIFPEKSIQKFWMYNMNFPLDVVWISDQTIVGLQENVPLPTAEDIPRFSSPVPVNYVLELNAGFIKEYGISVGDMVTFNL